MAERFGSQVHPSGGLRFGSQTYAALSAVVGNLAAMEAGDDVLAADSDPRITGNLACAESATPDTWSAVGSSSLLFTMHAHESPAPDALVAFGSTGPMAALRFGSQVHPSGGLRFGAQSWGALGPSGTFGASELGDDAAAAVGLVMPLGFTFHAFNVLAGFVSYGPDSLGAAIDGTLDTGNKVLLPVAMSGGISFTWEINELGAPSLRLARLTGASILNSVPWYVWNGSTWTAALFDVSDAAQGAAFLVETGADAAQFSGSQVRFGSVSLIESGVDALAAVGNVRVIGTVAAADVGADAFAASGAPSYLGVAAIAEGSAPDLLSAVGQVAIAGGLAAVDDSMDTFAASGAPGATGDLAATEVGSDALAAVGVVRITATLSATEAAPPDAVAASGAVRVSGNLVASDSGADAFAAPGSLERRGAMSPIETGADGMTAGGVVSIEGLIAATDMVDTFAATGTRESEGELVAAEVNALEGGADRFVARGRIGDYAPIQTFDGPVRTSSGTRVVVVRSRRTAEET